MSESGFLRDKDGMSSTPRRSPRDFSGAPDTWGFVEERSRRLLTRYPHRLFPVLAFGCVLVVLLIGSMILRYVETRLVAAAGESLALAAADITDKLDVLMAERYGDIQMMTRVLSTLEGDVEAVGRYLEWVHEAYPAYEWVGVMDETGRILTSTDQAGCGGGCNSFEWAQMDRGHMAVRVQYAASVEEHSHGAVALIFVAPFKGAKGNFRGAAVLRIALSVLEDAFVPTVTALQTQWGTTALIEYQFLDRRGNLITDSLLREEGQVNLKRLGLPSAQLFDSAPPGFIEERHLRRQVDVVTGHAMTKGMEGLSELEWGVLVRVDREHIVAPVRQVTGRIAIAGVGMILPLIGILWWSAGRLREMWASADQEKKRAQAAERKLHQVIDSAPDAIVMTDPAGCIVMVNQQTEQLFGFTADELCGRTIETLIPERFHERHRQHCGRFAESPAVRPMGMGIDLTGRRRDGTEFSAEISLSYVESEEGRFVLVAIRDVTRQKVQDEELRASKEAAEASTKAKSAFLATMSHEIRTPMNGIIGMTGLLLDTSLTAEQREYAETVRASGEA